MLFLGVVVLTVLVVGVETGRIELQEDTYTGLRIAAGVLIVGGIVRFVHKHVDRYRD